MHSRKGSGLLLVNNNTNKNKNTTNQKNLQGTAEEVGIPPGATGDDSSQLPSLVGPLKKQSRRGKWQKRTFKAINHYLVYYASTKMRNIRCVHDLVKSSSIQTTGRFGYFELEYKIQDEISTVSMKAKDLEQAEVWVENLRARRDLFQTVVPKHDIRAMRRGTYLVRAVENKEKKEYLAKTHPIIRAFETEENPQKRARAYLAPIELEFQKADKEVRSLESEENDNEDREAVARKKIAKIVEKTTTILTSVLNELNTVASITLARNEEVLADHVSVFHPYFLDKLRFITWGHISRSVCSLSDLNQYESHSTIREAHEALRLLSLVNGWSLLLQKMTLLKRPAGATMFLSKEVLWTSRFLSRKYVERAMPDLLNMTSNISL